MCMLPPLLSLMSWLIKANRIYPQRCSALYGLFQKRAITDCLCLCLFYLGRSARSFPKKGNYRFYGVIILRKVPQLLSQFRIHSENIFSKGEICRLIERENSVFISRKNIFLNFNMTVPNFSGKFSNRNSQSFLFQSSSSSR